MAWSGGKRAGASSATRVRSTLRCHAHPPEADPVDHQDAALRRDAGAGGRRHRARLGAGPHPADERAQPGHLLADRAAQRVVRRRDAGLGAVRAGRVSARSGVPRDRPRACSRRRRSGRSGPTGTTRRWCPTPTSTTPSCWAAWSAGWCWPSRSSSRPGTAWPGTGPRSASGSGSRGSTRRSRPPRSTTGTAVPAELSHASQDLPLEGDRAAAPARARSSAVLVLLFAEPVAEDTTEEVSTELLGTQVDVGKLDLLAPAGRRSIWAPCRSPIRSMPTGTWSRPTRSGSSSIPSALAEKKIVVERLALHGMRFGTTRKTAGPAGQGRRLRAAGAARGATVGAAVRRAAAAADADRHHQASWCSTPTQLTTVRDGPGAGRPHRLDPEGPGAGSSSSSTFASTVDSARALAERLVRDRSAEARPRRHPAGHPVGAADAQADRRGQEAARGAASGTCRSGVQAAGSGRPGARRGAAEGLRLRPVAAQAAQLLARRRSAARSSAR